MRPLDHLDLIRVSCEERRERIDEDLRGLLSQVYRKLDAARSIPEVLDVYYEFLCNVFAVFAYNHIDGVRNDYHVEKYQAFLCDLVNDVVEYAAQNLPTGFGVEVFCDALRDTLHLQASDWESEAINRADGVKRGILETDRPPAAAPTTRPVPTHRFRGRDPLFREASEDEAPSIHVTKVRDDLLSKLQKQCTIWDEINPHALLSPDLLRHLLSSVRPPNDVPPMQVASPHEADKGRKRGPKADIENALRVAGIVAEIAPDVDWRTRLDTICDALDEGGVPFPTPWRKSDKSCMGWADYDDRSNAVKAIEYRLKLAKQRRKTAPETLS